MDINLNLELTEVQYNFMNDVCALADKYKVDRADLMAKAISSVIAVGAMLPWDIFVVKERGSELGIYH